MSYEKEKKIFSNNNCPLCNHSSNNFFLKYVGSFLNIDNLLECENCKLIFASKMPSNEELGKFYNSDLFYDSTPNYDNKKIINYTYNQSKARLNLIKKKLEVKKISSVVDIGGGFARFGKVFKENNPDCVYDIVEPSLNMKKTWGNWINKDFLKIDDLDENNYDLAIVAHVLEHVNNPVNFLNSIMKKMRPNSYIFIEVPYQDYLYKKSISPHVTFWNKESIQYLSKLLGLNCIFLDSCGLDHKRALYFYKNQNFFHKIINPFMVIDKLKDLTGILNFPIISDDYRFKLNVYGGNRIWLRTIMIK